MEVKELIARKMTDEEIAHAQAEQYMQVLCELGLVYEHENCLWCPSNYYLLDPTMKH